MPPSKRKSILCPNCNKLISADQPNCFHCGIANPGSYWKNSVWLKRMQRDEFIVPALIYTNAAFYILSLLLAPSAILSSTGIGSILSPDSESLLLLGASGTIPIDGFQHWWSLLAATYLHGSLLHIVFNMMALRAIAPLIINEYGVFRMFSIYTLGGILSFLASYLAGTSFTVGASGAICALIGAALYYGKSRGGVYGGAVFRQTAHWVAMIFLFALIFPGIDNWAHGGGLAGGIVLGWLLGYQEKRPQLLLHKSIALACVWLTLGVLAWAAVMAVLSVMAGQAI